MITHATEHAGNKKMEQKYIEVAWKDVEDIFSKGHKQPV